MNKETYYLQEILQDYVVKVNKTHTIYPLNFFFFLRHLNYIIKLRTRSLVYIKQEEGINDKDW